MHIYLPMKRVANKQREFTKNITIDDVDLCVLDALASWLAPSPVAAWELSIFELISPGRRISDCYHIKIGRSAGRQH